MFNIKPIPPSSAADSLFAEASAWFFRLRADQVSLAERQEFTRWLDSSPQHSEAWNQAQALFASLEAPAKAMRRRDGKRRNLSRRARVVSGMLACACLTIALLDPPLLQNLRSDYHTATGEQRRIDLADGSHVLLNTNSAVSVDLRDNLRRVQLLRGEAYFEVAHAPQRPFWVVAGEARARVTGTAFSVGRSADQVTITVAEGRVETSSEALAEQITPLTPGESASYQGQQLASLQSADVSRTLAWRQGQMVFVQASLAEVVEQINRYRPGRLMITDRQLASRPITAVFKLDRLDEAVAALEQTLGIRARRLTDYLVLLG